MLEHRLWKDLIKYKPRFPYTSLDAINVYESAYTLGLKGGFAFSSLSICLLFVSRATVQIVRCSSPKYTLSSPWLIVLVEDWRRFFTEAWNLDPSMEGRKVAVEPAIYWLCFKPDQAICNATTGHTDLGRSRCKTVGPIYSNPERFDDRSRSSWTNILCKNSPSSKRARGWASISSNYHPSPHNITYI